MRSYLNLLTLPVLALAALDGTDIIDTPDAGEPVQMVSAAPLLADPGNACPSGDLGRFIDSKQMNTTLIFDKFAAYIGNKAPDSARDRRCNYQIVIQFPKACTDATINITPRGTVQMSDKTFSAVFESGNTFNIVASGSASKTTNKQLPGADWASATDKDFMLQDTFPVSQNIQNENQRNVTLTIRMHIYVTDQGNKLATNFGVDSLDVSISGVKTKKC